MDDAEQYLKPNRWGENLGVEILERTTKRVTARMLAGDQHHQPYGILHGGVYASIVEEVASSAAGMAARELGQRGVVGVSNHTDFLRSHSEGELQIEALALHQGRRSALWEVKIHRASDGVLISRGQVRFQVLDVLPGERAPG